MNYLQVLVDHAGNSTTTIPFDLIVEILSLLPPKSLIRFQSVSKLWFSTIRNKNFVDSFLIRSKTRPRILFTLDYFPSGKRFFFSAPEHNNNGDDKSSTVVAIHNTAKPHAYYISSCPVNGFLCVRIGFVSLVCDSIVVWNPTTRQIVKLPNVRTNARKIYTQFGYDPEEDAYKVLCVMIFERCSADRQNIQPEHLVCTVSSSQKQEWRKVENTSGDNYRNVYNGICIDGAIYYGVGDSKIVRFDVRSEKMELIKVAQESNISNTFTSNLINYNGKLGGIDYADRQNIRLWILEDAEKQEWSSKTFAYPYEWKGLGRLVVSKGVIHTGDLMLVELCFATKPFSIYYYSFNKESTRIVEIQGMVDGDFRRIHDHDILDRSALTSSYPGYVESIRFL